MMSCGIAIQYINKTNERECFFGNIPFFPVSCYNKINIISKGWFSMNLTERFLKYVAIDTQSDPYSDTFPSTEKQKDLAGVLVDEMLKMGISDARMDNYGYVYGSIPGNVEGAPALGLIAHMDTAPDMSGANIKPRIIHYEGGDIVLNQDKNIVMKVSEFPILEELIGQDLIVTDGTTLLGSDDKGGIAEIMTVAEHLLSHPEVPHGKICIGFTPDEEVGGGPRYFDYAGFGADFAYTMDGGHLGEVEYENFNAAGAEIIVNGVSIHPGYSKNKMVNSMRIAMELDGMLPIHQRPESTEMYEGFFHLTEISGNVEQTRMHYIIRDHDMTKFQQRKEKMQRVVDYLNQEYGAGTIELNMKDSYFNMAQAMKKHMHLVENARKVVEDMGLRPITVPIRGGTDGATFTNNGLPCPNLGAGGFNGHGKFEFSSIQQMEGAVQMLLKLIELYSK